MSDNPSPEMLSAYLDGELTADECEQVEQWLATNEPYRRELRELQQLHDGLKALPRYRLPASFPARVLERIDAATGELPAEDPQVAPSNRGSGRPWPLVLGAIGALAAALLLAVALNWQRGSGDTEVVQEPAQPPVTVPGSSPSRAVDNPRLDPPPEAEPDPGEPRRAAETPAAISDRASRLLIDVSMTREGMRQRIVEQSLVAAGLRFGEAVEASPALQQALLAAVGGGTADAGLGNDRPRLELVFVRGSRAALQQAVTRMASAGESVTGVGVESSGSESALFDALDAEIPAAQAGRIRKIVLPGSISRRLIGALESRASSRPALGWGEMEPSVAAIVLYRLDASVEASGQNANRLPEDP